MLFIITSIDIYKGIKSTIESALMNTVFNGVPVVAEDNEGVIRPSIKINIDDDRTEKFNYKNKERTLTVRVYFFAKDKNKFKIDNLKMKDVFSNTFLDDVKITDSFYMPIDEDGVSHSVVDGVLECTFDLYSLEEIEDNTEYEMMEELTFDLGCEGDE